MGSRLLVIVLLETAAVVGAGCQGRAIPGARSCGDATIPALESLSAGRIAPTSRDSFEFLLTLRGQDRQDAVAMLCVFAGPELVYYDRWDTRRWWDEPPLPVRVDVDSVVRDVSSSFFDEAAFAGESLELAERHSWLGECNWAVYPAVAESLKELLYPSLPIWLRHRPSEV